MVQNARQWHTNQGSAISCSKKTTSSQPQNAYRALHFGLAQLHQYPFYIAIYHLLPTLLCSALILFILEVSFPSPNPLAKTTKAAIHITISKL
jgi:hypothetical protein